MPEESQEEDKNSTGWPEHKMSPWPDYVKILIKSMWINGMPPMKIAEKINDMGVLGKPVHPNTISQFMSATKRKEPEILDQRKENIEEFKEAAIQTASNIKDNILGAIKQSTLAVCSELTDKLPRTIRENMAMLEDAPDPKTMREAAVALKIQVDILTKLSGVDVAARLKEYHGKKLIDLEFATPPEDDGDAAKNVTPSVVPVEGWEV